MYRKLLEFSLELIKMFSKGYLKIAQFDKNVDGRSSPGSWIQDDSDHDVFKEPMNSRSGWIHRLLVHHDPRVK